MMKDRINILFVHRTSGMLRGGGELFIVQLSEELKKINVNIDFLVGRPILRSVKYKYTNLNVTYLRSPYLWRLAQIHLSRYLDPLGRYFFERRILFYLRKNKKQLDSYDLVIVHINPRLAYFIKREFKKKVLFRNPGRTNDFILHYARMLDGAITAGDGANYLQGVKKVYKISPGVNTNIFKRVKNKVRAKYNISKEDFLMIYVGRLNLLKNVPFLIESFSYFNKKIKNTKLMLVGEGEFYKIYRRKLSNNKNIILVGDVSQERLAEYYSAADVFVLMSKHDCEPNALYEAKACGLPVIAANVGGIPHILKNRKGGFLINHSLQEFTNAAIKLYKDKKLRIKMGNYNLKESKCRTWEHVALEFRDMLEEVNKK